MSGLDVYFCKNYNDSQINLFQTYSLTELNPSHFPRSCLGLCCIRPSAWGIAENYLNLNCTYIITTRNELRTLSSSKLMTKEHYSEYVYLICIRTFRCRAQIIFFTFAFSLFTPTEKYTCLWVYSNCRDLTPFDSVRLLPTNHNQYLSAFQCLTLVK